MRTRTMISAILTGLFVAGLFAGEAVNFSGTWVPDESKMQPAGEGPRMVPAKMIVKQAGDSLSTERHLSNPMMGDFTVTEKLTLDGKECVSETEWGGSRNSIAVWSDDHKMLTIKSTVKMNRDGQEMEMKSTEVWSLDENNTILKIQSTRESPRGLREATLYFKKGE
jgi:hypothetical protein